MCKWRIRENLVMMSTYTRTYVRTLGVGVKDSLWQGRHVRWVSFWPKISHFRGNQRSCSSKNLDCSFLCLTYDKTFGNKCQKLCFLPGHAFGLLGELMRENSCNIQNFVADLRTDEAHFLFQKSFKIVLVLPPQTEIQLLPGFSFSVF